MVLVEIILLYGDGFCAEGIQEVGNAALAFGHRCGLKVLFLGALWYGASENTTNTILEGGKGYQEPCIFIVACRKYNISHRGIMLDVGYVRGGPRSGLTGFVILSHCSDLFIEHDRLGKDRKPSTCAQYSQSIPG